MFQVLWINKAIVDGSGDRACGFFSSEACFSEIDTGALKYAPNMKSAPAPKLKAEAKPAAYKSKPMSIAWMKKAGLKVSFSCKEI
jgi:hypothetical protein